MIETLEELQRDGVPPDFELIEEAAAISGIPLTTLVAYLLRRRSYPLAAQ